MIQQQQIVVVGGGMVGLSAALALADCGLQVAVIDNETGDKPLAEQPELRVSAINLASSQFLSALGAWQKLPISRLTPYQKMQVWEQDSFARIGFDHAMVNQPQLGHIIENQAIRSALWQQAQAHAKVQLIAPAKIAKLVPGNSEIFIELDNGKMLTAELLVGADGANSFVRQQMQMPLTFWDYGHQAIVATIKTQQPHQHCARQAFTPTGPLAFLPLWDDNLCSIVWSQTPERVQELMAMDDIAFNQALTVAFDNQLGLCEVQSKRVSFPLKMQYCRQWLKNNVVLVGDAAHSIHPLAGQGVNLGFMDAAALAQQVTANLQADKPFNHLSGLRGYERWRKSEATKMIAAMEGFKRLFAGANPLKKLIRDIGLTAADKLPLVKEKLIAQAIGLEGDLPELAKSKEMIKHG